MKKVSISQSLIKDMDKYFGGEKCGHLIYNQYTKKIYSPPTPAMALGQFFEYEATGALPKDGKIPTPDFLKDGVALSAEYRRAAEQVERFKYFCEQLGIEILAVSETKTKNGLTGTRDYKGLWNGKEYTFDLKYSGLINNVWDEIGWGDLYNGNNRGKQYAYHSTQSLQYTYIFEAPFIFWIFSSVNVDENIMIEMVHDEIEIEDHVQRAADTGKKFNVLGYHDRTGLSAIPEYNTCKYCVLKNRCNYKAELPTPKQISITKTL